jgi:hypothetical protein
LDAQAVHLQPQTYAPASAQQQRGLGDSVHHQSRQQTHRECVDQASHSVTVVAP